MKLFICFFIVIGILSASGQTDTVLYETLKIKSDSIPVESDNSRSKKPGFMARKNGDLGLAIKEYSKEYKKNPGNIENVYNLACAYAICNYKDSAFHYLNIAIAKDSTAVVLIDPDLILLIGDKRWAELEERQVKKIEATRGKYGNIKLARELWKMYMKNQAYSYHVRVMEKKNDPNSYLNAPVWELKKMYNRENLEKLSQIIDKHGWPKISDVGYQAAYGAFMIVQHADLSTQKKYFPLMKKAAEDNEFYWSELVFLIDRIKVREGDNQVYGTQVQYNIKTRKFEPFPIDDEKNVDRRRAEAGLPPLKDYLKKWDIDYKGQ